MKKTEELTLDSISRKVYGTLTFSNGSCCNFYVDYGDDISETENTLYVENRAGNDFCVGPVGSYSWSQISKKAETYVKKNNLIPSVKDDIANSYARCAEPFLVELYSNIIKKMSAGKNLTKFERDLVSKVESLKVKK